VKKLLISISGNIAVGKSTIGSVVAQKVNGFWISESTIADQFPELIKEQSGHSKLLCEITFASLRLSLILSSFLRGEEIIVTERYLWEDWIFYEMWRDRFELREYDILMEGLFEVLNNHKFDFKLNSIILTGEIDILLDRLLKRNQIYNGTFTKEILLELSERYEKVLANPPNHIVKIIDTSNLNINNQFQLNEFVDEIIQSIEM
jgi:deoxyadenosine/deoxycytidine kinase